MSHKFIVNTSATVYIIQVQHYSRTRNNPFKHQPTIISIFFQNLAYQTLPKIRGPTFSRLSFLLSRNRHSSLIRLINFPFVSSSISFLLYCSSSALVSSLDHSGAGISRTRRRLPFSPLRVLYAPLSLPGGTI